MTIDIRSWCSSGNKRPSSKNMSIRLGHQDDHRSGPSTVRNGPCNNKLRYLKILWMRLKKKGIVIVCDDSEMRPHRRQYCCTDNGRYDPSTYSQNFDHGFAWDDDHDLSRSFSFRFSDPNSSSDVFLHQGQNRNIDVVRNNDLCV